MCLFVFVRCPLNHVTITWIGLPPAFLSDISHWGPRMLISLRYKFIMFLPSFKSFNGSNFPSSQSLNLVGVIQRHQCKMCSLPPPPVFVVLNGSPLQIRKHGIGFHLPVTMSVTLYSAPGGFSHPYVSTSVAFSVPPYSYCNLRTILFSNVLFSFYQLTILLITPHYHHHKARKIDFPLPIKKRLFLQKKN